MIYNYFIPLIHLGPPEGYTFSQAIPFDDIKNLIVGKSAKLEINRKIICNKKILYEKNGFISFNNDKWSNKDAADFTWKNLIKNNNLSYIETHINLIKGDGFKSTTAPAFYVSYTSPNKKNFISCGNEKYGNPRVIMQMQEFGIWVDGYPAINVSYKNSTTYSLIIINPYKTVSNFVLELNNLKIKKNIKVNAFTAKKINFYDIIQIKEWTGQFYIYGKRRAIIYLINHDFYNVNNISTLEHGDPFRAELTFAPRFQYLRNNLHKKIKTFFK